ncbi:MAG: anti-sigma factor family protein [Rhodothermales bacterium]
MHLEDYTIARYLDGSIEAAEQEQLEAHLADCSACCEAVASAYRMVQAVEQTEAPLPDAAAVRRAERLISTPRRVSVLPALFEMPARIAVAAVVVVAIGLVAYFSLVPSEPSRFRTESVAGVFEARAPEDGAIVDGTRLSFSWSPLQNAVGYRLKLYADEGVVLWQSEAEETSLVLPATVRLKPGTHYLWRVEGVLADGTTQGTELRAFRVAP